MNGDTSQLAKLPAVDSDEEDELVQLTSKKQSTEPTSTDHLGREHPFSPMVNREMLGTLVRRAFHQTEEQQTNFEQMLKHEYGRRSKGEVSLVVVGEGYLACVVVCEVEMTSSG